ncbi:hypothetical protein BP6252_14061 [Coleophoma cylindrospora]|uniref:Uncharacterized protein n=1 Tax=Coleophoma cylindrospora TaxID=1849047 RepID=A0A3D8Q490_9HELO|nr:hypothetical protein BP6252_14061 [Coleophoma cylindrospora]
MDGGEKEKQMAIEIRTLVKAKNDCLRSSRALEAKRRQQCRSKETASSFDTNIPASKSTRYQQDRLLQSLIAVSNPLDAPGLHAISLSLKNQDSQCLPPGPVSCEHWIKVLIDDVYILGTKKNEALNPNEIGGFQDEANRLQSRLEDGIRVSHRKCVELTSIIPDRSIQPAEAEAHLRKIEVSLVNCLFAHAALIYLHITVHGAETAALPATKKLVFEWIFTFRFIPEYTLLPSLVWSLCMAGCMATTENQRQFFRETVASSGIDSWSSYMIWRALEIMEICWHGPKSDRMQPGDPAWIKALEELRNSDVIY